MADIPIYYFVYQDAMFDLPNAKRVRRDDLLSRDSSSPSASPPPDSAVQSGHELLGKLLDLDAVLEEPRADTLARSPRNKQPGASEEQKQDDEEEEFEFRLFSAPNSRKVDASTSGVKSKARSGDQSRTANDGTQKLRIRIRSPTPVSGDPGEGRFVRPFRGWEYYFSTPALYSDSKSAEAEAVVASRREQYEDVAVTGEQLLSWAKTQPWPGCHLPWRVIHLKRHQTKLPPGTKLQPVYIVDPPPPDQNAKSRKRPGKKRRIQLRKRTAAAKAAKETEAEKRNRKNRERKLKRRQKAREAKAAAAVAAAATPDHDDKASIPENQRDGSPGGSES